MNRNPGTPRSSFLLITAVLGMIVVPAILALHTVRVPPEMAESTPDPSPYGYTVSLLLFVVPIAVIGLWFIPQERLRVSKQSFVRTIALLFPLGAILDFFFARSFLTFPNPNATLHVSAPALGGGVPVEEYIFYFTGFVAVLLIYIWLDEYWLSAYSIPVTASQRMNFERLLRFHMQSAVWAVVLLAAAIAYRKLMVPEPGFPGYFTFLVLGALGPSAALLPEALPVVNWRAFSMTLFLLLLMSLLWEATLGVPYGWWGYQESAMIGIHITAWNDLPVEAVCVWIAVTYVTVIVYEIVRRWQSSGKTMRRAFWG